MITFIKPKFEYVGSDNDVCDMCYAPSSVDILRNSKGEYIGICAVCHPVFTEKGGF